MSKPVKAGVSRRQSLIDRIGRLEIFVIVYTTVPFDIPFFRLLSVHFSYSTALTASKLLQSKPRNILIGKTQVGMKNALDFQLVSYLGYMIREAPEENYCIISNDKAFDLVGRFWQEKNVNVCCAVSLEQAEESGEHSRLHSELEKLITNSDELEFVEKCINELTTKSGINNRIVKKYGTTRAGEIYRLIKPLLTDKKGDTRQQ